MAATAAHEVATAATGDRAVSGGASPTPAGTGARALRSPSVVLVLVAGAVLRVLATAGATPRLYNDSGAYAAMASEPLVGRSFLAGERSWTVPLLYKALPDSDTWRVVGAVGVAVVCWSLLALAVHGALRTPWLRTVAVVGILASSLTDPVVQWDPLLLTESVSISLTALVVAAWVAFARSPSVPAGAALAGAAVLWVFARDPHAHVALLACGIVVLHEARRPPARRALALGVVAVVSAAAVASLVSASTDTARPVRVDTPMLHLIGSRIIPDDDAARWFHERGMPLNAEIREVAPDLGFAAAPPPTERTEPIYRWARAEGRTTYVQYLLAHPVPTATEVATRGDDLLLLRRVERYRAEGARPVVPAAVQAALLHPLTLLALALLALALVRGRTRVRASRPLVGVMAVVMLVQVPYAALVVHGDTIELGRHGVEISLVVRLATGVLALAAVDALVARRPPAATVRGGLDVWVAWCRRWRGVQRGQAPTRVRDRTVPRATSGGSGCSRCTTPSGPG